MKFFKNRSLKRFAIYLLAGMFFILLTEYLIIRHKIEVLEEEEEKKDFVRSAQLEGQHTALQVQQFLSGQEHLAVEIAARLSEHDHALKILRDGGRIDDADIFLKPLARLPRITFDQLQEGWNEYKENVELIIVQQANAAQSADSAGLPPTAESIAKARALLPAKWLTLSKWFKKLEVDLTDEANEKKNSVENWVFLFILFDLILLGALYYLFDQYVLKPIRALEKDTVEQYQNFAFAPNELGNLTHQVNEILEQLKDATEFVGTIGEGKLDFDYKLLDTHYAPGKNKLADSLISMQRKLRDMNVEEQRRQWANEGLTKFVNILRSSNDNINTLGDLIISTLVQYTGSNQGGLYVVNDENPNNKYIELISLFAFNTKKFEQQKIKIGEGIIGQTFLEKETTMLTEIPDEYIRITSGLGEANPKALVIVPLKVDKEVYGMVELASFKLYEAHEIEFVEKLAETIASTLASVKTAQKNKQLIEQFHEQTEQMHAQEEEVRQNMEELTATQEEMARKEKELSKMLDTHEKYRGDIVQMLNEIPAKIFLKDSRGYIVICNQAVAESYNLPIDKIIGTHDKDHFDPEQVKLWEAQEAEIKREGKKTFVQEERKGNKLRYLQTTKMPFEIKHLNQLGLMGFQIDVTENVAAGQSAPRADDWALAEEIEKTLRIQLEALRMTQEETQK
jgi:PAS domain-containing protein